MGRMSNLLGNTSGSNKNVNLAELGDGLHNNQYDEQRVWVMPVSNLQRPRQPERSPADGHRLGGRRLECRTCLRAQQRSHRRAA